MNTKTKARKRRFAKTADSSGANKSTMRKKIEMPLMALLAFAHYKSRNTKSRSAQR